MLLLNALPPRDAEDVRELVRRGAAQDGAAALDDAALLALGDESARHLLVRGADETDEDLIAAVSILPDGTVQGLVDPGRRGQGHGTRLLAAVLAECPDPAIWIHGAREESYSFLCGRGFEDVRTLLRMRRPLTEEDAAKTAPDLPEGMEVSRFEAARDAEEWVALNARAFADHPEQGDWTLQDLRRRLAEDWFDASDLTVVHRSGRMVAFCWIKRVPGEEPELHVLATDPEVQGQGLASRLLDRDIVRLARDGQPALTLYVEGDNETARGLYERRGFVVSGRDTQMRRRKEHPACA